MDFKKLQEEIILHLLIRFAPDCNIWDLKFEINFQGRQNQTAAILIFGLTSIIAGILTLFLPETHGKKLPDTLHEGLSFDLFFLSILTLFNNVGPDWSSFSLLTSIIFTVLISFFFLPSFMSSFLSFLSCLCVYTCTCVLQLSMYDWIVTYFAVLIFLSYTKEALSLTSQFLNCIQNDITV